MQFIIPRTRWYRGRSATGSQLCVPNDGRMCCLGIYLAACGVPPKTLEGKCYPSALAREEIPAEALWLVDYCGLPDDSVATQLAVTNDRRDLPESEREKCIRDLFHAQGIDVAFTDDEPQRTETAPTLIASTKGEK